MRTRGPGFLNATGCRLPEARPNPPPQILLFYEFLIVHVSGCQRIPQEKPANGASRVPTRAISPLHATLLLAENGYPPVDRDEVYKEIFEQAENFKKYQGAGS